MHFDQVDSLELFGSARYMYGLYMYRNTLITYYVKKKGQEITYSAGMD